MGKPDAARRVLLVEDDDDLRLTLAEMLSDAGFDVALAENGQRALEQLRNDDAPSAIILDLMMPGLNGWEFRVRQKLDPALAATPVVVISADARPEARAIDADLFLTKPFEMKKLLDGLGRVLTLGERRRVADKLAREDRLAAIATLAAGLAHEINNPLMAVLASLELVQRICKPVPADPLATQIGPHVDTARKAALHVQSVISNVSSFARPDDHLEVLDARPVLEAALSLTAGVFPAGVTIDSKHDPIPPVRAGRGHLLQVFVNLLDNAAQALGGTQDPRLRTRTFVSAEGRAVIEIGDSGSGIPPDDPGKIFDPFFTTRAPGQGTGLGLSICHSFVARFSGTIEVESEFGGGSSFRVVLPVAASGVHERVSMPETIPPLAPAHAEPPAERIRVLVADDEPLVCSVLEHVLAEYDVCVVTSGHALLELLATRRDFDIVLCDLNLSDLSGLDVFESIDERWPELCPRFVLMTGGVRSQKQAERLATSGARVLSKPFELDLLLSVVESTAALARSWRALAR